MDSIRASKRSRFIAELCLGLCVAFTFEKAALASYEDYVNETLAYQTEEANELEPEYWLDLGVIQNSDIKFSRDHVALEYGLSGHTLLELRAVFLTLSFKPTVLDTLQLEGRHRFLEAGKGPLDVAAAVELNTRRRDDGSFVYGMEPRLIVSKTLDPLQFTLNLAGTVSFSGEPDDLVPSFGLRFNFNQIFRLGAEVAYGNDSHEGAVTPQAWLDLPGATTLKIGDVLGFDQNRENFFRFAFEFEFLNLLEGGKGEKE